MNQKELNKILTNHRLWLVTKGEEGKRADLWGADLKGADLEGADLRRADFRSADLREADLRGANLIGADLRYANLKGANFRNTDLRDANLKGAWLDEDWKGVPLVLGNVLVTECIKPGYFWRIKTWSVIKESNQELFKELYL